MKTVVLEELGGVPRVLTRDACRVSQRGKSPQRDVTEVPDRRRYELESSGLQ